MPENTDPITPAVPQPRRPRGWAARYGEFADQSHAQATADAETHAAAKPALCHCCGGTGLAHTR